MSLPQIIWSPHGSHRTQCLVGETNGIRLYEYINPPSRSNGNSDQAGKFQLIGMHSEPNPIKSFDWSPNPNTQNLIAMAHQNGKLSLLNLPQLPAPRPLNLHPPFATPPLLSPTESSSQTPPLPFLNPRGSRTCHQLHFSSLTPNLLAGGFERSRTDNSLLIWDISLHDRPSELSPIHSSLPNDQVVSVAWIPHQPHQLWSGSPYRKMIRRHDLRDNQSSGSSQVFTTKSVYLVQSNPFNNNTLISFGEDNLIRVWDDRKLGTDSIFSFGWDCRLDMAQLQYCPIRKDRLVALNRETHSMKVFDLNYIDWSEDKINHKSLLSLNENGTRINGFSDETMILERTLELEVADANAVCWVPIQDPTSKGNLSGSELVVFGGDGGNLKLVKAINAPCFTWAPNGGLAVQAPNQIALFPSISPPSVPVQQNTSNTQQSGLKFSADTVFDNHPVQNQQNNIRARALRKKSVAIPLTPDPQAGIFHRKQSVPIGSSLPQNYHQPIKTNVNNNIKSLAMIHHDPSDYEQDISEVMLHRAQAGYHIDPRFNIGLVINNPELREVWEWVQRVEKCYQEGKSKVSGVEINYQSLWNLLVEPEKVFFSRYPSPNQHNQPQQQNNTSLPRFQSFSGNPTSNQSNSLEANHEDKALHHSHYNLNYNQLESYQMRKSATTHLERPNLKYQTQNPQAQAPAGGNPMIIKTEIRRVLLEWFNCFPKKDMESSQLGTSNWSYLVDLNLVEKEILKLETLKRFELASFIGFIFINFDRGLRVLKTSGVERFQLIALTLTNSNTQDSLWIEGCKRLMDQLTDPYLLAIFTFALTRQWTSILSIGNLPLVNKLQIIIIWLSDLEVAYWLKSLFDIAPIGAINQLLITGINSSKGIEVLQDYLDSSGDIQTVSLLTSLVPSHNKVFRDNLRVLNWTLEYRKLLDCWGMFRARVKLDIERAKRSSKSVVNTEPLVQPQIVVRCNFCNHPLIQQNQQGSQAQLGMKSKKGHTPTTPNPPSTSGNQVIKNTVCPHCKKPLPNCCLCLLPLGESGWFSWCQTCRHGGHSDHLLNWFKLHNQCPVSDCGCYCKRR